MSFEERLGILSSLGLREMKALFEISEPVEDYRSTLLRGSDGFRPVRFVGRNSLPMFRTFEKRFFAAGKPEKVYGFNSGWINSRFGCPGFFEAVPRPDGELVFDYTARFPEDELPAGNEFPCSRFRPNRNPLYGGMQDIVRQVGPGILIGEAHRVSGGKSRALGVYFILMRRPADRLETDIQNRRDLEEPRRVEVNQPDL